MKKEYRIKKNEEFQSIIRKKQSVANRCFVVYYRKNNEHLRIGISVSKKLGNAVVRNKVKRQVRMMAQEVFDKDRKNDLIIIVRNQFLKNSYEDNQKELRYLNNKIIKRTEK